MPGYRHVHMRRDILPHRASDRDLGRAGRATPPPASRRIRWLPGRVLGDRSVRGPGERDRISVWGRPREAWRLVALQTRSAHTRRASAVRSSIAFLATAG